MIRVSETKKGPLEAALNAFTRNRCLIIRLAEYRISKNSLNIDYLVSLGRFILSIMH